MLPLRKSYRPMYMSDFFENNMNSFHTPGRNYKPAVNVREDEKNFNIELAVPGVSKDEIKIEIEKDILIISSEKESKKETSENGYNLREFGNKSFCRSFTIPENANREKINASHSDGVLNIEIPKSKEDVKLNRVIKIS